MLISFDWSEVKQRQTKGRTQVKYTSPASYTNTINFEETSMYSKDLYAFSNKQLRPDS